MLENLIKVTQRIDFESPVILKKLALAHRYLGELKGAAASIPNQNILLSSLSLQESQQSSEIENIVSTQDALYKSRLNPDTADSSSKEVHRYTEALIQSQEIVKKDKLITLNTISEIQGILLDTKEGFRKKPGTVIINSATGEIIYRPPEPEEISSLLSEWEKFANQDDLCPLDSITKMALLHHQFESIHPFYDGNGRTGRIINILYLMKQDLLNSPILYLSRYINQTRNEYYRLLQGVRDEGGWQDWVAYIIDSVHLTAKNVLALIQKIKSLLEETKEDIQTRFPKIYSLDLLNNLFTHPYTKVQFLADDLNVSTATATRYLDSLTQGGLLKKEKSGRENYYINSKLVEILFNIPDINAV